ncbi:MAG TPA: hypothetical protein VH592_20900 [Gemmataceae bacterium]|jgi:hypothetical protein
MQIIGEWLLCPDSVSRPVVRAQVAGAAGRIIDEHFLVDSGADRTVFSADLAARLQLPFKQPPGSTALLGIGGGSDYVLLTTSIEFTRDNGAPALVRGEFASFTDPLATDMSILGRDILNNFDVVISRPRNEVLLLAPNHSYHIMRS